MDEMIDKLILLLLGSLLLFHSGGESRCVVVLLLAITFAALGLYFEEKIRLILLFAVSFVTALIQPMVLFFFPLLFYDMVRRKIYVAAVPFLGLFLVYPPPVPEKSALWLITAALAVILSQRTAKRRFLGEELIRIRDSGTELNLMLIEKNKHILEKQDYEIYLATLKERNRIAREIHDNVGHMLSRSILMTGALLTIEKEGTVHNQLLQMKDTLDLAMNSIRQSVHDLHNDSIDLKRSITEIADSIRSDFDVNLDYDVSKAVPRRVKYCLIAITKEAVSNILKHSNGSRVQIFLREHPSFYQLSIEDNGTNTSAETSKGIGLENMRERVASLGGIFQIHTLHGFTIFLTIPKTEENLCE